MADYDPIVVVPEEDPDQTAVIGVDNMDNPYVPAWWNSRLLAGIPENVMGWLVSQGWRITGATEDASTNPSTYTYALAKEEMSSTQVLLSLCNNFTKNWNDAKFSNEVRYEEIVNDWTEMIASSQTQFEQQIAQQNSDLGVYIGDLDTYMDEIDALITDNRDNLSVDYGTHQGVTRALLTDLGTTEVARITEHFSSTLAVQLQGLIDRGLYSAGVAADITERNQRDRDEQLQKHYDSLNRENLGNEHTLWGQRVQIAQQANQAIVQKMNTATARLDGWKQVAAENQRLMAYQLDERNKLLIGLYAFVEKRDDLYPDWKDMSSMIAGLGDSAGGWITP